MRYLDQIQSSLDYIEENLKTDITPEELSAAAGFSVYHYYRLFQRAVGMPVMRYITRRRLLWAAYDLARGEKIVDVALTYGFDTAAGFYKAFVREFNCGPSDYTKRFRARKPYRIHLLQEEQIMMTVTKAKEILKNWDMQQAAVRNVLNDTGEINDHVFEVGDAYYLKICANFGAVQNNIAIATALDQAGLATAVPVKTKDGKNFAAEGELYCLLSKRIPGKPANVRMLLEGDWRQKAYDLGMLLGKLHQVLKANDRIVCNERDIFEEVRTQWLEPAKKAMGLRTDFCEDYVRVTETLDGKLPEQIIHRDPNPANLVMEDGKLTGFLDFDLSQRSIRVFDPCYAATAILSEIIDESKGEDLSRWMELYQGIIHGYDAVAVLTESEKQALPYVVLSIQLICVGYFSGSEKLERFAEKNIRMTRWLMERMQGLGF